jgi:hypothetical protein
MVDSEARKIIFEDLHPGTEYWINLQLHRGLQKSLVVSANFSTGNHLFISHVKNYTSYILSIFFCLFIFTTKCYLCSEGLTFCSSLIWDLL